MLKCKDLEVSLPNLAEKSPFRPPPLVPVLSRINIDLHSGECLGVVGESGCGKTTLGKTLIRLHQPSSGSLMFKDIDITRLPERDLRPMRYDMQMIFQDPQSSLNPRRRIGESVIQPLKVYGKLAKSVDSSDTISELLETVGLDPSYQRRFPHELSGGERQRACIARAISLKPSLVIADEIVSGLDVSNQAQILHLLSRLQRNLGLALVFISHDLSVVRSICDKVTVLLNGKQIESGSTARIFQNPRRRYTKSLIQAVPLPEVDRNWLNEIEEDLSNEERGKAMNISGSVALVTGANRGIGRTLVEVLVAKGARKIYATARDPSTLQDLTRAHSGVVESIELDITDHSAVTKAATACNDVELLINNAGINHNTSLIAVENLDNARAEMETNYFGTLAMCRSFAPVLRSNGGGCIVNMLSVLSRVTLPLMGSLCASKAATLRLTQGVRAELTAQNTTVLAVMPGAVDTQMTKDFPPPKMPPKEVAEAVMEAIETGTEEIYPGDMASGLSQGLAHDPKAVEKELAAFLPS